MSIDDFLAKFGFGSANKRRPEELDMFFRRRASPPRYFDDDILLDRSFDHVFHEMDQMMRGFDYMLGDVHGHGFDQRPALNIPIHPSLGFEDQENIPPPMLKKRDVDYDDVVSKYGLETALDRARKEEMVPAQPRTGFFSAQKQMRIQNFGDGKRIEVRSFVDSQGNKHEVTKKSIGDKTYTITNKTDPRGDSHKIEEFDGMEEADLQAFNEEFNTASRAAKHGLTFASQYREGGYDAWEKRPWRNYLIDNFSKWF